MSLPYPLINSRWELEEYSRRSATGIYFGETRMLCRVLGDYPAFVDTKEAVVDSTQDVKSALQEDNPSASSSLTDDNSSSSNNNSNRDAEYGKKQ